MMLVFFVKLVKYQQTKLEADTSQARKPNVVLPSPPLIAEKARIRGMRLRSLSTSCVHRCGSLVDISALRRVEGITNQVDKDLLNLDSVRANT